MSVQRMTESRDTLINDADYYTRKFPISQHENISQLHFKLPAATYISDTNYKSSSRVVPRQTKRLSLPVAPYAITQRTKAQLKKKIDFVNRNSTNKQTHVRRQYETSACADIRVPKRIARIQSTKRRPSNSLGLSYPVNCNITTTPRRTQNVVRCQGVRDVLKSHCCYEAPLNTYDDTESTVATLIDNDDEFTRASVGTSLDIINDFEVLMPNLAESQIMFDLFPNTLQVAISYLQRSEFTYTSPFDYPVLPVANGRLSRRPTLALDLDETLMHCAKSELHAKPDFLVHFDGHPIPGYVYVRPYAVEFLKAVSAIFEVVIFTAGTSPYANQVLDQLDPKGEYIHHRLFRQHCTYQSGGYVKDLKILGRDLKRTILVDNSPICAAFQLDNLVPISSWQGDESDRELHDLVYHLTGMADVPNVAKWLSRRYGLRDWINAYRQEPNYNDHANTI